MTSIDYLSKKKGKTQMKFKTRLSTLLLALAMLLACFISCAPENEPEGTLPQNGSENVSETESSSDVNQFETPSSFDIITAGQTEVKIIRPQNLSSENLYVSAAIALRNEIEDATGIRLTMGDDFKKASDSYDDSTVEIIVGSTQHAQVAEATKDLGYGNYAVRAVGNKIVLFGYTEQAINYAVRDFVDLVSAAKKTENGSVSVSISAEELNIVDTAGALKPLNAVPVFKGTEFVATSTSDEECDQIILDGVTLDSYNSYLSELEALGYKKYTDNDLSGSIFTTLYSDEYTLNVGYYKPYDECRIIIEPFEEKTLIGLESDNKRPTVTTSQITMFGCEFKESSGAYKGNGLSLLYRLSDGSFVIVDGGHDTNSSYWSTNLISAITEQAKEYASGKDIRIAAWFISHAHGDHMGMLKKEAAQFARKFTVERVVANLMSDEEIERSLGSSYKSNFGGGEANTTEQVRKAARTLGADLIQCHPGQKFYFGDTVFEILYTSEMFAPSIVNALNTSSILVRSTTTDASGKSTSAMIMGDVTGPAMAICNKLYGSDLKCDIVQVAHHGYQTWGNDSAIISSYKLMSADIVLWPMGAHAYETHKEKAYNKVLWDGTITNLKGVYVAGWNGTIHTVPLPWNGDTASIVSVIKSEK